MNAIASVHTHKEHFDINLDGAGGDGVFQFTLIKGNDEEVKQGLLSVFYRNSFNRPPKSLNKLFNCYKSINNYQFYFVHQNIRRFSIFGSVLGHDFGVISRFPYLDHDLQEYIYSLPANIDYNKIYREILLSSYREYYLIDNNNTGSRVYVSDKLNFIARGVNFVRRKLGKTKYKNPYHNYPAWLKENDAGMLDKYLRNESSIIFKYIDFKRFKAKLDEYMESNANIAIISRALSLAIFLDYLENNEHSSC